MQFLFSLIVLGFLGLVGAAHATVTFDEDFDTATAAGTGFVGTGSPNDLGSDDCCADSIQIETGIVRRGAQAVRFELHESDPDVGSSRRSELESFTCCQPDTKGRKSGGVGDERWIGISFYLPSDWEQDTQDELIFQVHARADACDAGTGRSPPLALYIRSDGTWEWSIRKDTAACSPGNPQPHINVEFGDIILGQWVDVVINVKWEYDGTGFTKIWRNGVLIVNETNIANYYNDVEASYIKFGVYKWPWKQNPGASVVTERVLYFDEFKIGDENSSFAEMSGSTVVLPEEPDPTPVPGNLDPDVQILLDEPAASGEIVSGFLSVHAKAYDPDVGTSDGSGIKRVIFQLRQGSSVLASHTEFRAPYDWWNLDTDAYAEGDYVLRAEATSTKAAGGTSSTVDMPISIRSPESNSRDPVAQFTAPSSGEIISGFLSVHAKAYDPDVGTSDGSGIKRVIFQLRQGSSVLASHTEFRAPYDWWNLDTDAYADGDYVLRAEVKSTKAAGGTSSTVDMPLTIGSGQPPSTPPSDYVRPFGPKAPWNVPVMVDGIQILETDPNSDALSREHYDNSPANHPGNFELNFGYGNGYTFPVYDAREASGHYPVVSKNPTWGNLHGRSIPFNSAWQPDDSSNAQMIILDPDTGEEWDLWQVNFDGATVYISNGNLIQKGESKTWGDPGNYFTKENSYRSSREAGIQYLAMLVRPEEIEQGVIRHALALPIKNVDGCIHVAPATKHANPNNPCDWVPVGTRFALKVTDAEIEAHLASLPSDLPQEMIDSLRIVAVAFRDYGWIVTGTSGDSRFQIEDYHSADEQWRALGLNLMTSKVDSRKYPKNGLENLFTQNRIYALVPSDEYIVADAGSSQTIFVGDTVFLDAAASYDAGGEVLDYAWTISSKPAGSKAALDDPHAENPAFIADLPGTYEVSLVVSNGWSESTADVVDIEAQ